MGRRVPFTGAEKESLLASLERNRDVIRWKLDGLDAPITKRQQA